MTIQVPDSLIYQGKRFSTWSFPLESYFDKGNPRPDPGALTCCDRGYTAAWKIDQDTLYVTDIKAAPGGDPIGLAQFFPGQQARVEATWFTGLLHANSSDHGDLTLTIENGKVVQSEPLRRG